jgi:bifunctional DNA-binding transcriptional regulator/antitoxin component of YhaV-PrlF toxin-antitoxin module
MLREKYGIKQEEKVVHVHRFRDGKMSILIYKAGDSAVSDILPGLEIPLQPVFAE